MVRTSFGHKTIGVPWFSMVFSEVSRLLQLTTITKYYIIKFEINFKELIISWKNSQARMNGVAGHLCAYNLYAKLCQENILRMVRWMRWHCPPDTGLDIRSPVVWGRARSLGNRGSPYIKYLQGSEELTLCLFETWIPEGGRTCDLYSHHRA